MYKYEFPIKYNTLGFLYVEAESFSEAYDIINELIEKCNKYHSIGGIIDKNPRLSWTIYRENNNNIFELVGTYENIEDFNNDQEYIKEHFPKNPICIINKERIKNEDGSLLTDIFGVNPDITSEDLERNKKDFILSIVNLCKEYFNNNIDIEKSLEDYVLDSTMNDNRYSIN